MIIKRSWLYPVLAGLFVLALQQTVSAQGLNPGDIVLADQANGGRVVKVSGTTGEVTVVTQGGFLSAPRGVTFDESLNYIYVTERRSNGIGVVRIDAITGEQTVVSRDGFFLLASDIANEATGDVLVSDYYAGLIRVSVSTGEQQWITPEALTRVAGIAVNANNEIFAGSYFSWPSGPGRVSKVNPVNGTITVVSEGGLITAIAGLEMDVDGTILVTCSNSVVRVDPVSGEQSLVIPSVNSANVGVDRYGDYIIGDFGTGEVLRYGRDGRFLEVIADTTAEIAGFAVVPDGSVSPTEIDIIPNNSRNSISVRSGGYVKVAVLGSAVLDVSKIDSNSIRFGVTGSEAKSSTPTFRDVNRDGFRDLVAKFKIRETGISISTTRMSLECRHEQLGRLRGSNPVTPRR